MFNTRRRLHKSLNFPALEFSGKAHTHSLVEDHSVSFLISFGMDVPKRPIVFLSGTMTSMTFSRTEDGCQLVLKVVEREVKEGDKPTLKACRMYLNGELIKQEVEGPVEGEVEFEQVWREMFQKLDLKEGLMQAAQEREAALEVEEEEAEGAEVEEDFDRKLHAKAKAALGREFLRARMIKAHRKTLTAKLFEEEVQDEVDCQAETEPKSDQSCMRMFRKLGIKGQRKKKGAAQKSETEEKRATKDASSNTGMALELKDVSERFHH